MYVHCPIADLRVIEIPIAGLEEVIHIIPASSWQVPVFHSMSTPKELGFLARIRGTGAATPYPPVASLPSTSPHWPLQ
jgi:hypothetical protein